MPIVFSSNKAAAAEIEGLQVALLGAVLTNRVRFIHDHSFEPDPVRGNMGGSNTETLIEQVPKCLRGGALFPVLLDESTGLSSRVPQQTNTRIEGGCFGRESRNVRVEPEQAKKSATYWTICWELI